MPKNVLIKIFNIKFDGSIVSQTTYETVPKMFYIVQKAWLKNEMIQAMAVSNCRLDYFCLFVGATTKGGFLICALL